MNLSSTVHGLIVWATPGLLTLAADVWTASPLDRVFPDTTASSRAAAEYRLYAARGERESFQIAIEGGRRGPTEVVVEAGGVGKHIGPPGVRLVDYAVGGAPSPRAIGSAMLWPDVLLPNSPFEVEPGRTRAVWLTYEVGEGAPSGVHKGEVIVRMGKRRKRTVSVTIEVFDFAIPKFPSLRTHFNLDRRAIRENMAPEEDTWETWQSIYDALAAYRISYALADTPAGLPLPKGLEVDAERLAHLEYAARSAQMNTVNAGLLDSVATLPKEPSSPGVQDPLQDTLHKIHGWSQLQGLLDQCITGVFRIPNQREWNDFRTQLFRMKRLDRRSTRVLAGELSPFFERYAEVWAVPLSGFHLGGHTLLREDRSLSYGLEFPPVRLLSSNIDVQLAASAYDGSFFSKWQSDDGRREWLQIDFAGPVSANRIGIATRGPGIVADNIRVRTSQSGGPLSLSDVSWESVPATSRFDYRWLDGTFARPRAFDRLRIDFGRGPVTVYEISFGQKPVYEKFAEEYRVQPWLDARARAFPSFHIDADSAEYRLGPWVCWGHDLDGFLGGALNNWSQAWVDGGATDGGPPWKRRPRNGQASLPEVLLYPGGSQIFPSIRLELLRDGLEDYEYLRALSDAAEQDAIAAEEFGSLVRRELYDHEAEPGSLGRHGKKFAERRVRIGRALTALAKDAR
jgi:hypothetical protein